MATPVLWLSMALVGLDRQAFLCGRLDSVLGAVSLALVVAVLTSLGFWLFGRLKPAFVDEI